MNCCDPNGKCTCANGAPAEHLAHHDTSALRVHQVQFGQPPLTLAPGVVKGYRVPLWGTTAQRRELKRWLLPSLAFTAIVGLAGLAAGLIAGALQ